MSNTQNLTFAARLSVPRHGVEPRLFLLALAACVRRGGRRDRRPRGAPARRALVMGAERRASRRTREAAYPRVGLGCRRVPQEHRRQALRRLRGVSAQLLPEHAALARGHRGHGRGALAHRADAKAFARRARRCAIFRGGGDVGGCEKQNRRLPRRERRSELRPGVFVELRQVGHRRGVPLQHVRHAGRARARRVFKRSRRRAAHPNETRRPPGDGVFARRLGGGTKRHALRGGRGRRPHRRGVRRGDARLLDGRRPEALPERQGQGEHHARAVRGPHPEHVRRADQSIRRREVRARRHRGHHGRAGVVRLERRRVRDG